MVLKSFSFTPGIDLAASKPSVPYTAAMEPAATRHEHFVQFYEQDGFLLDEVSGFIGAGLEAGQAGIVIATPQHRDELERRLTTRRAFAGIPSEGDRGDRYIALDAAATLEEFMVGGRPDERRFADVLGKVIGRASRDGRQVRAFGEMVALLWAEGKHDAALRLEELWNGLAESHSFSLLCAYPMADFHQEEHGDSFLRICDTHTHVRPAESFVGPAVPDRMGREVVRLQQKAVALETEVARRRQAERDLRRRERELTDFLENAVEGLHQVGADGRILWANQAELDMLGYGPDEYIGRPIAEFHVDREVIEDILGKLQRGEALYDYPARLRCKDGSVKHVRIHSNALVEDGEFVHTRCFTRDVTDRVRLEGELERRLEQLAESDRRKDEFLAMLGHELRNPLGAIMTAVELMRLASDDPACVAHSREVAARQAAAMSRLVDDLLDVSRIAQGKIQLRREEVLLGEVVERAVELVRPLIDERRHRLTVDLPAGPVALLADTTRLVQVVANLLNNAAKYTEEGGNVGLTARREGTDLLLCVCDDGIGLAAEVRERVFDLFVQAPHASGRARGGLGIGLTLVRNLVELHGGSIEARSDGPGCGSEFRVRLPLSPTPEP